MEAERFAKTKNLPTAKPLLVVNFLRQSRHEGKARGGELFVFAEADSHFTESEGVHVIRTLRHVGCALPYLAHHSSTAACLPCGLAERHICR